MPRHLVGVLKDQVFARGHLPTLVDNGMENAPGIVDVQCHLLSQFQWFNLLYSKNHMLWGLLTGVEAGHVPRVERSGRKA